MLERWDEVAHRPPCGDPNPAETNCCRCAEVGVFLSEKPDGDRDEVLGGRRKDRKASQRVGAAVAALVPASRKAAAEFVIHTKKIPAIVEPKDRPRVP